MKTNGKINILQMVNGFGIGGGELKLLELVKHLNKDKYNVVVCSVGQGGSLQPQFEKYCPKVHVFSKSHKFDLSLIFKVARLMASEKIHIVQTTLFYADVIGAFAAKLARVPVVLSWEAVTHGSYKKLQRLAFDVAQKNIDLIVTVSDAINRKVVRERKIMPDKVKTIHYGVDTSKFRMAEELGICKRKELQFKEDDILVGVVARLTEQKGHRYLIEAAKGLVDRIPKIKFVFVGDGPLRKVLENQIAEAQFSNHFHFLNMRNDINEIINAFDIFVLPSLYEGLPNVILEAMACGIPVVATAVDGTPEAVVDGVTGLLVPPKSPDALREALLTVLLDEKRLRKMGKMGRKRIEESFTLDKQVKMFEELYDFYGSKLDFSSQS